MTSPQLVGGAVIEIRPRFASFNQPINQEFKKNAPQFDRHGRDAGAHFTSGFGARIKTGPFRAFGGMIGSGLALGIGGALAGGAFAGLFKAFKVGAGEVKDFSGGLAQTNAVLTSTGGAAHVTAGHVEDLAGSIQAYSGQTDDSIVAAEDLLLTFSKVRNEVGHGNDIFDQATKTVADMSKALGQDGKASAIQLGKALNDPIRGVTALQRVGVTFDDAQKKTIKTFVGHGNILGAQKIILRELGKEFGGTARAFGQSGPGQIERAKRAFEDVSQSLVGTLLPVFNRVIPGVTAGIKGIPVVVSGVAHALTPAFKEVRGGVRAMVAAFKDGGDDVTSSGFAGVLERAGITARNVVDWLKGTIPGIKATASTVTGWLMPSFRMVGDFVTVSVLPSLRNLAAVFTGTVLPAIRSVAPVVGGAILVGFRAVAFLLRDVLGPVLRGVTGFIRQHQTVVASAAIAIGTFVVVTKAVTLAQKLWAASTLLVRNAVLMARTAVFLFNVVLAANPIGIVVTALIALAAGLVYAYKHSETFRRIVDASFRWVKGVVVDVYTWIKMHWPLLLAILTGPVGVAVLIVARHWNTIKSTFVAVIEGIKTAVRLGVAKVVDFFLGMISPIVHGAARAFGWIPGIGGKLKDAAAAFDRFRKDTNDALSGVKDRTITVTATLGTVSAGSVHAAAAGWRIPGYGGGDTVPILAERGETIIPKHLTPEIAPWARSKGIPGFAAGGIAGGLRVEPRLSGLAKFAAAIDRFNAAVDKLAAKSLAGLGGAVAFAQSQVGKPYIWGSAGPAGYDCSGFVSALVNVVQGRNPYQRRFSTSTLPAGLFDPGLNGAFQVGWFRGNPGHVAATVAGVNMESRGGDGVVVGARSRGAFQSIFDLHGHLRGFAAGGVVLPGDPPFDLLDRRGRGYQPGLLDWLQGVQRFDTGGGMRWPPGTVGVNLSGETEHVWRGSQLGGGPVNITVNVDARGASDPAAVKLAVKAGIADSITRLTQLLTQHPGAN